MTLVEMACLGALAVLALDQRYASVIALAGLVVIVAIQFAR